MGKEKRKGRLEGRWEWNAEGEGKEENYVEG